jgi:hypothetical protein
MNYDIWKRRFIAMVHSQRRLISDKGKALSTVIDERKRLMWEEVLVLENVSQKYAVLITRYLCVFGSSLLSELRPLLDQVKSDNHVFHDNKDTMFEEIHHTLKGGRISGRKVGR